VQLQVKPEASRKRSLFWTAVVQNGAVIAATAVSLLFCLIIASLFWPFVFGPRGGPTLLRELSNFEVARGLITFLVAVTTVGIALILTVYVVVTEDQSVKDKFGLGKEVMAGLIGVLGTIIGFYFGATSASVPSAFKVDTVQVDPASPASGGKMTVTVAASGGKGPFKYSLGFSPALGDCPKCSGESPDGAFVADVAIPSSVPKGQVVTLTVTMKDKSGVSADVSGVADTKVTLAK
jgi:hypothetical protein